MNTTALIAATGQTYSSINGEKKAGENQRATFTDATMSRLARSVLRAAWRTVRFIEVVLALEWRARNLLTLVW